MQFKVWMDKDYKDAWKHYLQLCKISASEFYEDMLAEVGLKSPFKDGTIESLAKDMAEKVNI
jgi:hypothetical protein